MKKLIALLTLLVSLQANASLLSIQVSPESVQPGESIVVSLVAEEFTGFSAFDFDFDFDSSLFSFNNDVTSDLTLGLFGLSFLENSGSIAFSFLDFLPYDGSGDFTLAQFSFTALDDGLSSFNITDALFGNLTSGEISVDTPNELRVAVNAPSALSLFGLAMMCILIRRKVK